MACVCISSLRGAPPCGRALCCQGSLSLQLPSGHVLSCVCLCPSVSWSSGQVTQKLVPFWGNTGSDYKLKCVNESFFCLSQSALAPAEFLLSCFLPSRIPPLPPFLSDLRGLPYPGRPCLRASPQESSPLPVGLFYSLFSFLSTRPRNAFLDISPFVPRAPHRN